MFSMRSVLLVCAAQLSTALARVTTVDVPDTVKAGETFLATLTNTPYIQNWDDFGVIWGLKSVDQSDWSQEAIGAQLDYQNLYPTSLGNSTVPVTIPEGQQAGQYTLTAAIPYLVGVSGFTGIRYFTHTITVTQ